MHVSIEGNICLIWKIVQTIKRLLTKECLLNFGDIFFFVEM